MLTFSHLCVLTHFSLGRTPNNHHQFLANRQEFPRNLGIESQPQALGRRKQAKLQNNHATMRGGLSSLDKGFVGGLSTLETFSFGHLPRRIYCSILFSAICQGGRLSRDLLETPSRTPPTGRPQPPHYTWQQLTSFPGHILRIS